MHRWDGGKRKYNFFIVAAAAVHWDRYTSNINCINYCESTFIPFFILCCSFIHSFIFVSSLFSLTKKYCFNVGTFNCHKRIFLDKKGLFFYLSFLIQGQIVDKIIIGCSIFQAVLFSSWKAFIYSITLELFEDKHD